MGLHFTPRPARMYASKYADPHGMRPDFTISDRGLLVGSTANAVVCTDPIDIPAGVSGDFDVTIRVEHKANRITVGIADRAVLDRAEARQLSHIAATKGCYSISLGTRRGFLDGVTKITARTGGPAWIEHGVVSLRKRGNVLGAAIGPDAGSLEDCGVVASALPRGTSSWCVVVGSSYAECSAELLGFRACVDWWSSATHRFQPRVLQSCVETALQAAHRGGGGATAATAAPCAAPTECVRIPPEIWAKIFSFLRAGHFSSADPYPSSPSPLPNDANAYS